jgi:hypothetical protein
MHVEMFCICDSASFGTAGRMTLRGVHNEAGFNSFPGAIPHLTLAGRIRFEIGELGSHRFFIEIIRQDDGFVWTQPEQEIAVERTNDDHLWAWHSFMTAISGFPIAGPTALHFRLVVDGVPASTIVFIVTAEPAVAPAVARQRT